MFGVEKLGSVHFNGKKCYVLLFFFKESIPCAKILWCQIVRGVKLSVFTHGVKLSAVSNCPRCQIVRGVKLFWCQIVIQPFFHHCHQHFEDQAMNTCGAYPCPHGANFKLVIIIVVILWEGVRKKAPLVVFYY